MFFEASSEKRPPPLSLPSLSSSSQAAEQLYLIRSTVDAVLNTVLPEGNFPSTPVSADDRCVRVERRGAAFVPGRGGGAVPAKRN